MTRGRTVLACIAAFVLLVVVVARMRREDAPLDPPSVAVLSVETTRPQLSTLPNRVPASGDVAAWQEASIGAEGDGLRLTEVRVNVGDRVVRGQVLAVFGADMVRAELAEARAAVAQSAAEAAEADANAARAKALDGSGAMSAQQVNQYVVAALTARARHDAAKAAEQRSRLRVEQARVLAPGDGIVSARAATVGAVVPAGQELFRLISDGRLEWRAEVAGVDLGQLQPGQRVMLDVQGQEPVRGTLRMLSPSISTATRSGLVYVDLPDGSGLRAGAFARGHVEVGEAAALTVPQAAVLLRDGFHHVALLGPSSTVRMRKVAVGRRFDDRIEVTAGLAASETLIASGLGFLSEGDVVQVVGAPSAAGQDAAGSTGAPVGSGL